MYVEIVKSEMFDNSHDLNIKGMTRGKLLAFNSIIRQAKGLTTLEQEVADILRNSLTIELRREGILPTL